MTYDQINEEQMDYLREMFNIGSGNVVTALSQLMLLTVDMEIPEVYMIDAPEIPPAIGAPSDMMLGVRMEMLGDMRGYIFFLLSVKDNKKLVSITERAIFGQSPDPGEVKTLKKSFGLKEWELSMLSEMGNIISGVYLTALHDFCRLNVSHTVPVHAVDILQAILDEAVARLGSECNSIFVSVNKFIIEKENLTTLFLLIPDENSVRVMIDSMGKALQAIGVRREA